MLRQALACDNLTGNPCAAACTITDYASVSSAVKSCATITFSDLSVPPSSTLNLQKLQPSATVVFDGNTVRAFLLPPG
jgi:polygalacturonase